MADRGMSAAVLTEVAKSQNEPFHLVEIYFTSGTAYLTDAFKEITWNSNTYLAAGSFLTFSDITEENALTVSEIEVQLTGVDRNYLVDVLNERFMDQNLIIRKGFFDSSNAVIVDPIIIYSGKMDEPTIIESSETCTVSVKVANLFVDFLKTTGRYTNDESQKLFFPNDNGFQYAHQIIKEINWGKEGTSGGGGGVINPPTVPGFPGTTPYTPGRPNYVIPRMQQAQSQGGGIELIENGGGFTYGTVNAFAHNLTTGDSVTIAGAEAVGELPAASINKDHTITVVDDETFTFPFTDTVTTAVANGGGNEYTINDDRLNVPLIKTQTTTNNENVVTVNSPNTEVAVGDMAKFSDSEAVGGIAADDINNTEHYISSVSTNSFDVKVTRTEPVTSPPIKTTSSSTTVEVEMANNDKNVGDTVVIAGAADTGGIVAANINGTQTITAVTENTVSFTSSGTASSTAKGGGNSVTIDAATPKTPPLETTSSSTTVKLYDGAHGLAVGDTFTLSNVMPVANLTPEEINKDHTVVSVPDSDTVTFTVSTTANSSTVGGGSESKVTLPVKATSAVLGGGLTAKVGYPSSVRS